jgi:cytochrome o ubiquinol oxidase subunit 1
MYRGRIRFATPMLWFMGFVVLFTIGGVTGVTLAEPAADYQLHNSLFLVAHFHTMIVSGVLFGYFAGFTYWFPKVFGFTLNERWGRRAFWSWLVGFILAFGPLYLLGFMGATRRLDHYSADLGWQSLFIVAAIGALIIMLGVLFQIVQIVVSIRDRHKNRDTTGDPWDGRTLEWSLPSPVPVYNFAVVPVVHARDALWAWKQSGVQHHGTHYEDIYLPGNTALGIYIAAGMFSFGFAVVWHIGWLATISLLGVVAVILIRVTTEEVEYMIPAEVVRAHDERFRAHQIPLTL